MIDGFNPSRCAMLIPAEAPGRRCSIRKSVAAWLRRIRRSVEHSGCVRAKNFQRGMVRGDNGDASNARKCSAMATARAAPSSGSVAEPSSSSSTSESARRRVRDEINIGDVSGERREVLLDGLVVADVGQHRVEQRQSARSAGTGIPDCAISASSPTVFRATVLPPVLGPVMTSSGACDPVQGW